MSIVVDKASLGTNAPGGGATTVTLTTTQAVVAGGFIVLFVGWWGNTAEVASVSGGGLTWIIDNQDPQGVGGFPGAAIISAQAPSGLASSTVITVTFNTSTGGRATAAMSFTGVADSSPVDVINTTPMEATASAWSTGSLAIDAGSVLIAMSTVDADQTSTITSPSIEAFDWGEAAATHQTVGYRIESSAGSYSVAGAWTGTPTSSTVAVGYLAKAAQIILPDADTTTTGWTSTPLFSKINDSSDATVITATAS